jgi:starch-binding outer membrane protein, SusD/RagB family
MKLKYISYLTLTSSLLLVGVSCSDSFLETPPPGTYSDASLQNLKGVEGMLISTYAALDGSYFESWDNNYFNQVGGASNWVWGSIKGGDAYTGTEPSDGIDQKPVERHETQPSNGTLLNKWRGSYDGVAHANQTLRTLYGAVDNGVITNAATIARIEGEAKFLRAHFHFEVLKVFGAAAWVDETVTNDQLNDITNDTPIWPQLEADLQFAYANLPATQAAAGRANKWAAGAYLGKVLIFQAKWAEALTVLNAVKGGVTTTGTPFALVAKYNDNFKTSAEAGNSESIFAYEASALDGTIANGNYENTLNQPHGSSANFAGCCGFFQPSYSMVNSFKVDASGLPLFDTYNDSDLLSDEGLLSTQAFTPDATTAVDSRLDWTVGRRGIPYLDWGPHPGNNWIRQVANGGPFSPIKNVPYLSDKGGTAASVDWGFTSNATNVKIIRYADVLLWLAEAEAEAGSLANATTYVNQIRTRAANPAGFVPGSPANYQVGTYAATFASKAEALKAIRFERKLEFGMEGHRFFDLVRWDAASKAGKTALAFDIVTYLNGKDYFAKELGPNHTRNHLLNASMSSKFKYEPIPEYVITQTKKNVDQTVEWGGSRNPN